MFKVNDYVIYGSTGVCQIVDIKKDEGSVDDAEYYILHPVYINTMSIKTPVDNPRIMMRPLLTKDEVLSLIAIVPEQAPFWVQNPKERSNIFKAALKSNENEELIKIIRMISQEKQTTTKKISNTDENFMSTAEKRLYEEFSISLNIPTDEVVPFIFDHIPYMEKCSKN
jgi:CarD family transcriptional regulator